MVNDMEIIDELFDQLDNWRDLPKYQLERRVDIFFGIYLRRVLESKYNIHLKETIIPEFPIHKATINPDEKTHASVNMDYLALAANNTTAFFIELKTDMQSRRKKQDKYLKDAARAGVVKLLAGVIEIFEATNKKRKYYHLLRILDDIGMIEIPEKIHLKFSSQRLRGITAIIPEIKIISPEMRSRIVYVQPISNTEDAISFKEFASLLGEPKDFVSERFAESLKRWGEFKAGEVQL
jgi:hypothetical protein